ncbi:MAG: ATP-dependent zinc protease [Arenicellales bacterium]
MHISTKLPKPTLITIGWREWAALPELNIRRIKFKTDTGAKTSSLHAINIEHFERDSQPWVRFDTQLKKHTAFKTLACEARLIELRKVTNSGGETQNRPVIETVIVLGSISWKIQLTLADRTDMRFAMLLGRRAMQDHLLVDSARSHLLGKPIL